MGLIKDIQSDLDNAAVRIVGDYRARLHAAAVKLCGDAGEADDLVMRTFDAAFRETSSYDETKGELTLSDVRIPEAKSIIRNNGDAKITLKDVHVERLTVGERVKATEFRHTACPELPKYVDLEEGL